MRRMKMWPKKFLTPAPKWVVAIGRKWEKRLGLETWRISYYVRIRPTVGGAAEIRWVPSYNEAVIALDPAWLESDIVTEADVEMTLVHEQSHLLFAKMDDDLTDLFGFESGVFSTYASKREGLCDVLAQLFIARYKRSKS